MTDECEVDLLGQAWLSEDLIFEPAHYSEPIFYTQQDLLNLGSEHRLDRLSDTGLALENAVFIKLEASESWSWIHDR